jgi:hypothetical protein
MSKVAATQAEDVLIAIVKEKADTAYASAYDEDIAAADSKAVLGERDTLTEDALIAIVKEKDDTAYASAYDEDIAAADSKAVLGERHN